jgi:anti-sigma28 factor (negative regulator of flagellin synthesis)
MKIEERIGAEALARHAASGAAESQQARQAGRPGDSIAPGGAAADSAQISTLAGRIRGRLEAMAGGHERRVEWLAAEVQAGRYRVDPAALSRALASEALGETARRG